MYKSITITLGLKKHLDKAKIISFKLCNSKENISGISFAVSDNEAVYVPIAHKIGKNIDNNAEL